jgi:hypothetical protein
MLESEIDGRLEVSELAAAVVAAALEGVGEHGLVNEQTRDRIGKLDFAAGSGRHRPQVMKDARREHIATHNRQCRSRRPGLGLLDGGRNRRHATSRGTCLDDAPAADVLGRYRHDADHRAALLLRNLGHLLHHGFFGVDKVVGEEDGERLIANDRRRAQHGVAESQRLRLANENAVDPGRRRALDLLQQIGLVAKRELVLELVGLVEMILDRALVASRDEDHVGDAGSRRFFDRVLDQRLVDDRQHLLRARLGGRKEAGAHPRYREHGLRDFAHRHDPSKSRVVVIGILPRRPSGVSGVPLRP